MDINPVTNGENKLPAVEVTERWERELEIKLLEEHVQDATAQLERAKYVHKRRCEAGL